MYQIRPENLASDCMSVVRQTSMGTLIMWNISKVLKENPLINLKSAIEATQKRLQNNAVDIDLIISQKPENQYLSCAILAWQQLGHSDADSLYQFIEKRQKINMAGNNVEDKWGNKKNMPLSPGSFISYYDPSVGSMNLDAVGPVVKLPVDTTQIIMRVENNPCGRPPPKKKPDKATKSKIDTACCMDSACVERLKKLDNATAELRTRAEQLARREAKRVELLEKAENAWKDLEIGYQRRLAAAQEKEEDMNKYTRKLIEERNNHKAACTTLAKQLREKTNAAEAERTKLTAMEKELYGCACERLQLTQAIGRSDGELAEAQCKSAQLDRDLMFKEEQIRCKLQNMQNDADCARALTIETERTMHSELCALREQINAVSGQLLEEDAATYAIKDELEKLRQEKADIVSDLEGCQTLCTGRIQGTMEELNKKRQKLNELKDKVAECKCKLPVNVGVEVKRTPSFAALCKCQPEDRLSETCSCVSLRTTLLTNLLSDLFGGLQSELGGCLTEMPCQLLMCLDDKHNWDRTTPTKTNLRNYFSKLLIGELNIAVATSIEKYHARWIGASCADKAPPSAPCCPDGREAQDRLVEKRAQKLATKLAEQLFKERADQLTEKAKEVLKSGPPPCECNPPSAAAVYPVLVKPTPIGVGQPINANSTQWRRTQKDVIQLRAQLEDLKKVSVKKEDLKEMEENIVKVVQRSVPEKDSEISKEIRKKKKKLKPSNHRLIIADPTKHVSNTLSVIRKKQFDTNISKEVDKNLILGLQIDKPSKPYKRHEQSYAVNVCLCSKQKSSKPLSKEERENQDLHLDSESKKHLIPFPFDDAELKSSSVRQTKPIVIQPSSEEITNKNKFNTRPLCRSEMACFHKPPSNTSIDKLLETIAKWNGDLVKLNGNNTKKRITDQSINTESLDKTDAKNVSTDVSTQQAKICISKQIITDAVNNMEPQNFHITTDSEYMGAINLEKSNENYCKCVTDLERNNRQKNSNYHYKCIYLDKCDCNMNLKNKENVPTPSKVSNNESSSTNNSRNFVTNKHNNTNQFCFEPSKDITDHIRIQTSHEKALTPNDYNIKFLGVTLTKTNSKHKAFENENICLNILREKKDDNFGDNIQKSTFDSFLKATARFHEIDKSDNENKAGTRNRYGAPCDCSGTYDELKNLMTNVLGKQRGDYCKNEDKCLDTQSFDKKKDMPESCVCCNIVKSDESKDLEENAFYLLEEHLKTKLEEFKSSSCKALCISAEDEERLFDTILERVKKIIFECTNTIKCKCVSGETKGGSWHRAYVLLQEYLKIKIKRVQCSCTSSDQSKISVLPEIMDQVCNLIDKDFQRLKEICKCSNRGKDFYKTNNIDQSDIPERDNDNSNNKNIIHIQSPMKENKDAEISKITISQNISSQVSSNFGVDNKSCDVMKKSNENVSANYSYHKCCVSSDNEKCFCPTTKKDAKSVDFGKTEYLVNHCIDITKDTDMFSTNPPNTESLNLYTITRNSCEEKDSICNEHSRNPDEMPMENDCLNNSMFPYIGYTVKCTCNETFGATCTCSKSTARKNSDNINSMWNTLTSNKLNRCNYSYIMDTVSKKSKETEKSCDFEELEPICNTCNVTINVHCDDNTIRKDSKGNVPKLFASTYTPDENASLQTDQTIDWCDRSNTSDNKQEKMNDFSDNTYDSVLYYPMNNLKNFHRSEIFAKSLSPTNLTDSLLSNCDCKMVPLCHVKMLVESIENKLIHSSCTCESLSSKVCPVHSKTN